MKGLAMIARNKQTITELADSYLLYRDIGDGWGKQITSRVRKFVDWLGRDPDIAEITANDVNGWLQFLQRETTLAPETCYGYRAAIHAVWSYGFQDGYTELPPMRLRKIARPLKLVEAYTQEELVALYNAAKLLRRNIQGTTIPRCIWWPPYIAAAYSTALRRGCLLALERSQIEPNGRIVVLAKKTGKVTPRRLCPVALAGVAEIAKYHGSLLAFPRGKSPVEFYQDFLGIQDLAGIQRGSSKWIRRSAISYAESVEAGQGRALGGHSDERVTVRSYRDLRIAPLPVVEPPGIQWS